MTGKAEFAGDIRLPGMLHGRVLRPPVHGARLKSVDLDAARKYKDARVFQDGEFVGVVHPTSDGAAAALAAIKAEFSVPTAAVNDANILEHLKAQAGQAANRRAAGRPREGRAALGAHVRGNLLHPLHRSRGHRDPLGAGRASRADEMTVWVSTQRPFGVQVEVARALGMPEERVRVITPLVGGGFGGKSAGPQAVEAARLSKLAGAPVQVVWTREEEFFLDTFRPAAYVTISSGLTPRTGSSAGITTPSSRATAAREMIYDVPHLRTRSTGSFGGGGPHPFGTGAWRGPGSNTNIFARESHIDMMAARAGMDPVEFRLKNLANPRMAAGARGRGRQRSGGRRRGRRAAADTASRCSTT